MSKPLQLSRKPVVLGKSRIRRDPVPLAKPKVRVYSPELELWGGITGILLFAAALAVVIVGISIATFPKDDPAAAARSTRFTQCYNADGPNCVFDGNTVRVGGSAFEIAGIEAPRIADADCAEERNRGIDSAVRLAALLNGGKIAVGSPFVDEQGRAVRTVTVDGSDVAKAMIDSESARKAGATATAWCAARKDELAD